MDRQGGSVRDIPDQVWAWLRRELPDEEFRTWLWGAPEKQLRVVLGSTYDDVFSADYLDGRALSLAKDEIISRLPRKCICPLLASKQWLGIWSGTSPEMIRRSFETLHSRNPWLSLLRCKTGGEFWYVAYDTVEGGWYFERLTQERARMIAENDDWPGTFDAFQNVWPDDGTRRLKDPPPGFLAGVAMSLLS